MTIRQLTASMLQTMALMKIQLVAPQVAAQKSN